MVNSTVTDNVATVSGPNADSAGAGLEVVDELLGIRFSTIARNDATGTGTGVFTGGGGLDIEHGTTTLEATIVAANTGATGPDCLGTFTSNGFNLIGNTANCTFGATGTDQSNLPAKLGAFGAHGGPSPTIPLQRREPGAGQGPDCRLPRAGHEGPAARQPAPGPEVRRRRIREDALTEPSRQLGMSRKTPPSRDRA